MRPVTREEIFDLEAYPALRPAYRAAVIEHKARRRLALGAHVTLVFEDHETLRFQIQEMCWIERIADPEKVQAEIDVYNELVPGDDELTATLFIEITDAPEIRPALDRLIGIDEHVMLVLGRGPDAREIRADFDRRQLEADRISAVQYLRFRIDPDARARLLDASQPARVRIDHPRYTHEAELPEPLRTSLCETLAGGPAPLLELPARSPGGPARDELLFETAHARAYRPAQRGARDHVVVEPRSPRADLLAGDPEALADLLGAIRRAAAEVVRSHGRCRVQTDVGADAGAPRWHILPPAR
jgi:hypothetical protein